MALFVELQAEIPEDRDVSEALYDSINVISVAKVIEPYKTRTKGAPMHICGKSRARVDPSNILRTESGRQVMLDISQTLVFHFIVVWNAIYPVRIQVDEHVMAMLYRVSVARRVHPSSLEELATHQAPIDVVIVQTDAARPLHVEIKLFPVDCVQERAHNRVREA
jgi:hypothetical protein